MEASGRISLLPEELPSTRYFGISLIVETKLFVQVFKCIDLGNQIRPQGIFDCGREPWELGFLAIVCE